MKRIFFGLCIVPLALTLAACAPAAEPEPETPAVAEPEPEGPTRSIVNITGDLYRAQNNNHFTVFLVTDEGIIMSDSDQSGLCHLAQGRDGVTFRPARAVRAVQPQ